MKTRLLGNTGYCASILGIGDIADRSVPLKECVRTIHRAIDFGLNLIDTAPAYEEGYSEEIVGASLKGGKRDGMFLIDKIDHLLDPVTSQVESSLRALKTDYTDLFVFHALSDLETWEKIAAPGGGMDQLAQCIKAGKTRFRGISSHNPEVLRAALASGLCDVLMFPVGPFVHPLYIEEILPAAREKNVGTVCFKTFGAGKLLGDTVGYNQPLAQRPRGKLSSGGNDMAGTPELPRLTVAECLHYTLTMNPDVALLGMSFPNEQDAAFAALESFHPLSSEQIQEIRERAVEAVKNKGQVWWNPAES